MQIPCKSSVLSTNCRSKKSPFSNVVFNSKTLKKTKNYLMLSFQSYRYYLLFEIKFRNSIIKLSAVWAISNCKVQSNCSSEPESYFVHYNAFHFFVLSETVCEAIIPRIFSFLMVPFSVAGQTTMN